MMGSCVFSKDGLSFLCVFIFFVFFGVSGDVLQVSLFCQFFR